MVLLTAGQLFFHMSTQMVFQHQSIQALKRTLDGKRSVQELWAIFFFFYCFYQTFQLPPDNFCAVRRAIFEFLIQMLVHDDNKLSDCMPHTLISYNMELKKSVKAYLNRNFLLPIFYQVI